MSSFPLFGYCWFRKLVADQKMIDKNKPLSAAMLPPPKRHSSVAAAATDNDSDTLLQQILLADTSMPPEEEGYALESVYARDRQTFPNRVIFSRTAHTGAQQYFIFENAERALDHMLAPNTCKTWYALTEESQPLNLYLDFDIDKSRIENLQKFDFSLAVLSLVGWLHCFAETTYLVQLPPELIARWRFFRADTEEKYSCHAHLPLTFPNRQQLAQFMRLFKTYLYDRAKIDARFQHFFYIIKRQDAKKNIIREERCIIDFSVYSTHRVMRCALMEKRLNKGNYLLPWKLPESLPDDSRAALRSSFIHPTVLSNADFCLPTFEQLEQDQIAHRQTLTRFVIDNTLPDERLCVAIDLAIGDNLLQYRILTFLVPYDQRRFDLFLKHYCANAIRARVCSLLRATDESFMPIVESLIGAVMDSFLPMEEQVAFHEWFRFVVCDLRGTTFARLCDSLKEPVHIFQAYLQFFNAHNPHCPTAALPQSFFTSTVPYLMQTFVSGMQENCRKYSTHKPFVFDDDRQNAMKIDQQPPIGFRRLD